jgi:hypothetical protein
MLLILAGSVFVSVYPMSLKYFSQLLFVWIWVILSSLFLTFVRLAAKSCWDLSASREVKKPFQGWRGLKDWCSEPI